MALLVDDQGEMIDHIEHNVENAVDTGRKEIVQFQRKNREVSLISSISSLPIPYFSLKKTDKKLIH